MTEKGKTENINLVTIALTQEFINLPLILKQSKEYQWHY